MPRYIDADALYERTAEWEAQALAYVEELNRTPLEEMDEDEKAEWRRWTAILGERSAFKFDVADAPTADVRENVHAHWEEVDKYGNRKCSNCKSIEHVPTLMGKPIVWDFCPSCGAMMTMDKSFTD